MCNTEDISYNWYSATAASWESVRLTTKGLWGRLRDELPDGDTAEDFIPTENTTSIKTILKLRIWKKLYEMLQIKKSVFSLSESLIIKHYAENCLSKACNIKKATKSEFIYKLDDRNTI